MDRFRVVGPNRLSGRIRAAGAKNAALPSLAATLLADGPVVLRGVPQVADIRTMLRLLAHDGVVAAGPSRVGVGGAERDGCLELQPSTGRAADEAPYELVKTMRASVLVLGPLLARRGHARVSLPGGCAIGVRPIDQHLAGLEALGAKVELEQGYVEARADHLIGARFAFAFPTVTGTENVMMAATLARGITILENCAREPEIEDLARLLNAMGAEISGAGGERITIEGVERLGGADHSILPDRIEGGTYLIAAAATGGDVTVDNLRAADLRPLLEKLVASGADVESGPDWIRVARDGDLLPRDVVTAPHPGFPTDLQAQYMALMTQARGHAAIRETVFENRFQHVAELARMGASISVEGNLAKVTGPTALSGAKVMATDLRASACLVIAGLVAQGETVVDRIYHLDRGYEAMEHKLRSLGGKVERIAGG